MQKNGCLTWIYTMSDDMANQRGTFKGDISVQKNGSLTWIYTMSDDMANQRGFQGGYFSAKKMAA